MIVKKIIYSKKVSFIMKGFLRLFYEEKYLKGKYFEEKRIGFIWAFQGIKSRIFGFNKVPWPCGHNTIVGTPENIYFKQSSLNVFQMNGCYFQAHRGKIYIGENCEIAPNCGLITTNHDFKNLSVHQEGKDIVIGDNCWIGMNSVILPGVILGKRTIVGAGSVVTKNFKEGNVIIAGVPAVIIKKL